MHATTFVSTLILEFFTSRFYHFCIIKVIFMNYMIFLTYVSCPVKTNKKEEKNEGGKKKRKKIVVL